MTIGLVCPVCGPERTAVKDSRPREIYIQRRRECQFCGERFSTKEVPADEFVALKNAAESIRQLCFNARRATAEVDKIERMLKAHNFWGHTGRAHIPEHPEDKAA